MNARLHLRVAFFRGTFIVLSLTSGCVTAPQTQTYPVKFYPDVLLQMNASGVWYNVGIGAERAVVTMQPRKDCKSLSLEGKLMSSAVIVGNISTQSFTNVKAGSVVRSDHPGIHPGTARVTEVIFDKLTCS